MTLTKNSGQLRGIQRKAKLHPNNIQSKSDSQFNSEQLIDDYENEEILVTNTNQEQITINSNQSSENLNDLIFQPQPLLSASPDINEVEILIGSWLLNKSLYLAGEKDLILTSIVKEELIKRLIDERTQDIKNNILRDISTEILDIKFITQTSSRIVVEVKLKYAERILKNGKVISETTIDPFLNVKYILGFTNKAWKLADYISGV